MNKVKKYRRARMAEYFDEYPAFCGFLMDCTDDTFDFYMSIDYWRNKNLLSEIEKSFDKYIEKLYDDWHEQRLIQDAESAMRAKIEEPL
jgi:hypothetical protein